VLPKGRPAFAGDLAGGLADDGGVDPLEKEIEQTIRERHGLSQLVGEFWGGREAARGCLRAPINIGRREARSSVNFLPGARIY
jgi:hypothetical protein